MKHVICAPGHVHVGAAVGDMQAITTPCTWVQVVQVATRMPSPPAHTLAQLVISDLK